MLGAAHMSGRIAAFAGIFMMAGLTIPAVALGQATPIAEVIEPKPDECVIEPRKFQTADAATPIAAPSGVLPAPASLPEGAPASPEDTGAVAAVAREALACRNAGDLRRAYALMTDRFIEGMLGGEAGPAPEVLAMLQNRSERVSRNDRLELLSVEDVQSIEDGRIRAEVTSQNASTMFTDILLFAPNDAGDGWLIDESVAVSREPRP